MKTTDRACGQHKPGTPEVKEKTVVPTHGDVVADAKTERKHDPTAVAISPEAAKLVPATPGQLQKKRR